MWSRSFAHVFLVLFALPWLACQQPSAPPPPLAPAALLFDPRVALAPALQKLKDAGGDPAKVLRIQSAQDLTRLESGKRYHFVVTRDATMVVAPVHDEMAPVYEHPTLVSGAPVRTAGGIRIEKGPKGLDKVTVDQDSSTYCPTSESLRTAIDALIALQIAADALRVENRPPDCAAGAVASSNAQPQTHQGTRASFGLVMIAIGRRFEVLGKAVVAKRFELAAYELEELEEVFTDDLPHAKPPPLPPKVELAPFIKSFREFNIPDLRKAIQSNDAATISASFENAAKTCNGCHQATGRNFIDVPTRVGENVPRTDPK